MPNMLWKNFWIGLVVAVVASCGDFHWVTPEIDAPLVPTVTPTPGNLPPITIEPKVLPDE